MLRLTAPGAETPAAPTRRMFEALAMSISATRPLRDPADRTMPAKDSDVLPLSTIGAASCGRRWMVAAFCRTAAAAMNESAV